MELLKLQEKSEEDIDKSAVATHSKFQESWGKQTTHLTRGLADCCEENLTEQEDQQMKEWLS